VSYRGKDEWLRDVDARQRNVVFPDTVQNEGRFWRNIGKAPLTTAGKVGLAILAVFVFGNIAFVVSLILRDEHGEQELGVIVLLVLLIFGPIVGGIIWATRRTLRNIQKRHATRTR
jgi:predicted permease